MSKNHVYPYPRFDCITPCHTLDSCITAAPRCHTSSTRRRKHTTDESVSHRYLVAAGVVCSTSKTASHETAYFAPPQWEQEEPAVHACLLLSCLLLAWFCLFASCVCLGSLPSPPSLSLSLSLPPPPPPSLSDCLVSRSLLSCCAQAALGLFTRAKSCISSSFCFRPCSPRPGLPGCRSNRRTRARAHGRTAPLRRQPHLVNNDSHTTTPRGVCQKKSDVLLFLVG